MQGKVEVYKVYDNGQEELISSENNMIVDGLKEHFADIMTYYPAPSAVSGDLSGFYCASAFGIKAVTFGPARGHFLNTNAWTSVSGYSTDYSSPTSPSSVLSSLDEVKNNHLLPYPTNNTLSEVNVPGNYKFNTGHEASELIKNYNFSSAVNYHINSSFKSFSLNTDLSGNAINNILGLYEIDAWDTSSTLRHFVSGDGFDDTYPYGSISVSAASVTDASALEEDENVLFIRAFDTSSDPSEKGSVYLKQEFVIPANHFSPLLENDPLAHPIGFLEFGHSNRLGTNPGAQMLVELRDETSDEYYDFSIHEWTSARAFLNYTGIYSLGVYRFRSHMFNIEKDRLNHTFSTRYSFHSDSTGNIFASILGEPSISVLSGWKYGKVSSGDIVGRTFEKNAMSMFKGSTGQPNNTNWDTQTMLIQSFSGLEPERAYYAILDTSTDGSVESELRTSLVNTNTLCNKYKQDVALQPGFSGLNKTYSTSSVKSPYYNSDERESYLASDKCIKVPKGLSVSGTGKAEIGKKYFINLDFWEGYLSEKVGCGNTKNPNTGKGVVYASVTKNSDTLYWDWDALTWGSKKVGWELKGGNPEWQRKSSSISVTSELNSHIVEGRVNLDITIEALNDSAYFKNFSLMASIFDYSEAQMYTYNNAAINLGNCWMPVTHNSLNTSLASLYTKSYEVANPHITELHPGVTHTYYEGFNYNSSSLHRAENETKFILRLVDGPATYQNRVKVNALGMGDAGTAFINSRSFFKDILTSEKASSNYYFGEDDTFGIEFDESYTRRASFLPPIPYNTSSFSQSAGHGFDFNTSPGNRVVLGYTHELSTLNMIPGDTVRMAFEYNSMEDHTSYSQEDSFIKGYLLAQDGNKAKLYNWSTSSWDKYTGSLQGYLLDYDNARAGFDATTSANFKTLKSTEVLLKNGTFSPTTKLKWGLLYLSNQYSLRNPFSITNIRFYRIGDKDVSGFPEFPNPTHRTVQTPYEREEHSKFGHYPNYLAEFASSGLSGISQEQKIMAGAYLPSSGIQGYPSPQINAEGNLNSEGYIYETSSTQDWKGFTGDINSTQKEFIQYSVSLSGDDYTFMVNEYGGLGSIGLWTLNFENTYKKLKELETPLSELYNVEETRNNPVFKLGAKKVFNKGGLMPNLGDSAVRIVWNLKFI